MRGKFSHGSRALLFTNIMMLRNWPFPWIRVDFASFAKTSTGSVRHQRPTLSDRGVFEFILQARQIQKYGRKVYFCIIHDCAIGFVVHKYKRRSWSEIGSCDPIWLQCQISAGYLISGGYMYTLCINIVCDALLV